MKKRQNSSETSRVTVEGARQVEAEFTKLLPLDDKLFKKGYCLGVYEVTVDQGPRIRLPRAIVKVLKEHKVKQLWRFSDPTGPRIIICPGQSRQTYIDVAKQHLPVSTEPEEAYRKFICAGEVIPFRDHGRVSISTVCNKHMDVVTGDQVVIVGTGLWYEIWRQDDWLNLIDRNNRGTGV